MSLVTSDLLELALKEPRQLSARVKHLTNVERKALLSAVASGNSSRLLARALEQLEPSHGVKLALGKGTTVYFARTSLPALAEFELHFFHDQHAIWGRVVFNVPSFVGPGYFGVQEGPELVIDFEQLPPAKSLPQGFPALASNSAGLAGFAFANTQLRFHGTGDGLLTGSVWRNGRDQGAFVNLVRAV
jgi:hypothetical protein